MVSRLSTRSKHRRAIACLCVVAVAAFAAGCGSDSDKGSNGSSGSSSGKKGDYTIALSNSFLGNTWRQTMVKVFEHTAKDAQTQGLIKDFKVENTGQNTATEQIAQLKSLILQGVDAIAINAASPDALNPTIKQACAKGIVVVVFDSLASEPCAYKIQDSIADYGFQEGDFVAKTMGGKGNVLMVRGVVGSEPEKVIYENQLKALKKYPGIKIVRTLVGQASNSVTQQVVGNALPSLPKIDGVITGGSSLGAVQAFKSAKRPLPVVAFDNSGEALRFWQAQKKKDSGYKAVSVRTEPGQAAAAVWLALDVLEGKKPKNLTYTFPNIVIADDQLDAWTNATPNGNVSTWLWGREDTAKVLQANAQGDPKSATPPPVPTEAP
jgi:ribose transport system substrate-binding protein